MKDNQTTRQGDKETEPSREEQVNVLQASVEMLRDSFVQRSGPNAGKILEQGARRKIECLEATIAVLRAPEVPALNAQPSTINLLTAVRQAMERAMHNVELHIEREVYEPATGRAVVQEFTEQLNPLLKGKA